jgi:hypothetical protein
MANPKEAKRILDALPAQELKALEELSQWHESVSSAQGFKPADRLQLLAQVDDAAQPRVRKLAREYFAAKRPSRYQENLMWTQLHEYWRQAGQAWARTLDAQLQAGKGGDPKTLPLGATLRCSRSSQVAARTLWPIDPTVGGVVNKTYAVAEERNAAGTRVSLGRAARPRRSSNSCGLRFQHQLAGRPPAACRSSSSADRRARAASACRRKRPRSHLWTDLPRWRRSARSRRADSPLAALFWTGWRWQCSGHIQKTRRATLPTALNLRPYEVEWCSA